MITQDDIDRLFEVLKGAYANLWRPNDGDKDVWLRKLGGFTRKDILVAANIAIDRYKKYPPTLGQFTEIVSGPPKRANTYNAPNRLTNKKRIANLTMLNVIRGNGPVPPFTLNNMVKLKNALSDEWSDDITRENVKDLHSQLIGLVNNA